MFENEFYPTPEDLAAHMVGMVDLAKVRTVLEPSAGKGDLLDALEKRIKESYYRYDANKYDIDCIEFSEDLRRLLIGKEHRVIFNNFLKFETLKKYDLILMNPPFSEGDKHLLKALELMKDGGQIVCILNAETLKNAYTNTRRELLMKLEEYDAQIEYLKQSFTDALRPTEVEIAVIYMDIPRKTRLDSLILTDLQRPENEGSTNFAEKVDKITFYDLVLRMEQQFKFEVQAAYKLLDEYDAMKPYVMNEFRKEKYPRPIISIKIDDNDFEGNDARNRVLEKIRLKYWRAFGESPQLQAMLTSNLQSLYQETILELSHYDFNLYNVEEVNRQLQSQMSGAVEETILNLFDEFSQKHSWYTECNKNIHYYNGWATNKAHKINKKVIIPLNGFDDYYKDKVRLKYGVSRKLRDIEMTLNYLDTGRTCSSLPLEILLEEAEAVQQSKNIDTKYFKVTFYKKGTCHLEFKDLELLKKFNIFGSQRKGWLPPDYGRKNYQDMTAEEQTVINEFDGSALEYQQVIQDKEYYLVDRGTNLVLLNPGAAA